MAMTLTVIGLGYLGATHAVAMAELGHNVIGIEADEKKLAALKSGQVPFYEPGLADFGSHQVGAIEHLHGIRTAFLSGGFAECARSGSDPLA